MPGSFTLVYFPRFQPWESPMSILIRCPKCKTSLTLTDERAGTSLECPNCETNIAVPTILPSPATTASHSEPSPHSASEPMIGGPSIEFRYHWFGGRNSLSDCLDSLKSLRLG